MKKTLAILLAITMVFALVACTGNGKSAAAEKVATFVEENKDVLLSTMEESFATSSGMTCTSSIKAEDCGFVIHININDFEDVSDEIKVAMQGAYDALDETFEKALDEMQTELPELEYFKILVCEKDGDEIATIHAGN